jgi:hypothetical protein
MTCEDQTQKTDRSKLGFFAFLQFFHYFLPHGQTIRPNTILADITLEHAIS